MRFTHACGVENSRKMKSELGWRTLTYASASIFRILITLITLPLMTNRLDAADYGVFALAGSVAAVFSIFPSIGSTVVMARTFHGKPVAERRLYMTSNLLLSTIIGIIAAVLYVTTWTIYAPYLSETKTDINLAGLVFVSVSIVSAPWAVLTSDALTLDGRARRFAVVSVCRDICGAIAALTALYGFNLGATSLFIGLCAAATMDILSGVMVLRPFLGLRASWQMIRMIGSEFHLTVVQLVETGTKALERILISRNIGLDTLGIISHSQTYETVSMAFVKSLSRSVWPENLNEAKDEHSDFAIAHAATDIISVVCLCGAIFVGTVGYDIIGLLTHGKFNYAAYFAAVWIANIALTTTGLAPKAVVVVVGRSYIMSAGILCSRVVSLMALFLLIGHLGEVAVVVTTVLAAATSKTVLFLGALRIRNIPFQDGRAIICAMTAFLITTVSVLWADTLQMRLGLFLVSGIVVVIINRRIVLRLLRQVGIWH